LLDDAVPMLVQGCSDLCRFGCQYFTSHHNHHVSGRQPKLIPAKAFTKQSLQHIAFYRGRYLFPGDRKPEARALARFIRNQNCNTGIATSDIVLKYLLEIDRTG